MKLVIQRCQEASVSVNGKTVGAIEKGLMVLIGVGKEDTTEVVDKYLKKLLQLRIFEDENGKTNRSLMDIGGQLLLVSQFTLYAIADMEIDQDLRMPEILKKQKSCMNI